MFSKIRVPGSLPSCRVCQQLEPKDIVGLAEFQLKPYQPIDLLHSTLVYLIGACWLKKPKVVLKLCHGGYWTLDWGVSLELLGASCFGDTALQDGNAFRYDCWAACIVED